MNPDTIVELLDDRPFQPFEIHVSDGRSFEVRHPEFAMVSRDHVVIGIPSENDRVASQTHFVSLRNITSASQLPSNAA
jgi:hypothetical protein